MQEVFQMDEPDLDEHVELLFAESRRRDALPNRHRLARARPNLPRDRAIWKSNEETGLPSADSGFDVTGSVLFPQSPILVERLPDVVERARKLRLGWLPR
jgi:hypothetical protein